MRPKAGHRSSRATTVSRSERGPGRPPVEDPKAQIISLRLAGEDAEKLDDLVSRRARGRSAVLRDLIAEEHKRQQRK
jgi:hypothetical protein